MPRGKDVPQSDRGAIVALSNEGLSQRAIGKKLGIPKSSVNNILQRFKSTNSFESQPHTGQPFATTPRQDKVLVKLALKDRRMSAAELNKEWRKRCPGVDISKWTVNRRLLVANLPARTPRRKPLKTELIKARG